MSLLKNTYYTFFLFFLITSACTRLDDINPVSQTDKLLDSSKNVSINIDNYSFESSGDLPDWNQVETVQKSSLAFQGSSSAKLKSGGKISQDVTVSPNTSYTLSAYVLGSATLGVENFGGTTQESSGNYGSWTKVTVNFTSGNQNSARIYAKYNGSEGRVDVFELLNQGNANQGGSDLSIISSVASDPSKIDQVNNTIPENSYDDNPSTRFSMNGVGEYVTYDLGSTKIVGSVHIAWYKGDQRTTNFEILAGTSTNSLSKVFENTSSGTTTDFEEYNFSDVSARYVRIVGLGNSSNNWLSINEIKIMGEDGTGGNPGPGPGNTNSPYNTINLQSRWKITLPRSIDGNSDADEVFIDPSQNDVFADGSILDYEDNRYFYTDGTLTYFKCQGDGETTGNSSNPRSELREMKEGGSIQADWNMNTNTRYKMSFKVRVMQTSQSRKLCFAQIHAKEDAKFWDDILRIQIESDEPNAGIGDSGHIYIMGTGNDDGHDIIINNYTIGDELDMRIEAFNGKYEIYLNNSLVYTSPKTNITSDRNYFKAGCYLQSVTSAGKGGEGIVAFRSIVVNP